MSQHSLFAQPQKLLLALAGVGATAILLAGCNKTTTLAPAAPTDQTAAQEMTPAASPAQTQQTQMTPTASTAPAQDTNQAATNESTQLNALNKDSNNVDQSFSDQAVPVN